MLCKVIFLAFFNDGESGMKNREGRKLKKIKFYFLVLLFLSIFVFCSVLLVRKIFFTSKGVLNVFNPKKITFNINSIYSDKLKENLINFVSSQIDSCKLLNFNPNNFYKMLKQNFKIIKGVEWDFTNPEMAKLEIFGVNPFCKINNKFVLGNKKRLFNLDNFKNYDLNNLQSVDVAERFLDHKIATQAYLFLNKFFEQNVENYNLNYMDDRNIMLLFKNKNISLLVDDKCFFDSEKMSWVNIVNEDFQKKIKAKYQKNKGHFFDMRFKDRILVRSDINNNWGRG